MRHQSSYVSVMGSITPTPGQTTPTANHRCSTPSRAASGSGATVQNETRVLEILGAGMRSADGTFPPNTLWMAADAEKGV